MADSIRELIVKDIKITLEGIKIASGFNNDIVSVQRLRQSGIKKNLVPTIVLDEGDENSVDEPGIVQKNLEISVAVVTRHDETADNLSSSEFIAPLRDDVDRALMADRTRGGNADETTFPSWERVDIVEGQPELITVGTFNVRYFTSQTDSTVKGV